MEKTRKKYEDSARRGMRAQYHSGHSEVVSMRRTSSSVGNGSNTPRAVQRQRRVQMIDLTDDDGEAADGDNFEEDNQMNPCQSTADTEDEVEEADAVPPTFEALKGGGESDQLYWCNHCHWNCGTSAELDRHIRSFHERGDCRVAAEKEYISLEELEAYLPNIVDSKSESLPSFHLATPTLRESKDSASSAISIHGAPSTSKGSKVTAPDSVSGTAASVSAPSASDGGKSAGGMKGPLVAGLKTTSRPSTAVSAKSAESATPNVRIVALAAVDLDPVTIDLEGSNDDDVVVLDPRNNDDDDNDKRSSDNARSSDMNSNNSGVNQNIPPAASGSVHRSANSKSVCASQCALCLRNFAAVNFAIEHTCPLGRTPDVNQWILVCRVCGKRFFSKAMFEEHLKTHAGGDAAAVSEDGNCKAQRCTWCGVISLKPPRQHLDEAEDCNIKALQTQEWMNKEQECIACGERLSNVRAHIKHYRANNECRGTWLDLMHHIVCKEPCWRCPPERRRQNDNNAAAAAAADGDDTATAAGNRLSASGSGDALIVANPTTFTVSAAADSTAFYPCTLCCANFFSGRERAQHFASSQACLRIHFSLSPWAVSCGCCARLFKDNDAFLTHTRKSPGCLAFQTNPPSTVRCPTCRRLFKTMKSCRGHIRWSVCAKVYPCIGCNMTFPDVGARKQHMIGSKKCRLMHILAPCPTEVCTICRQIVLSGLQHCPEVPAPDAPASGVTSTTSEDAEAAPVATPFPRVVSVFSLDANASSSVLAAGSQSTAGALVTSIMSARNCIPNTDPTFTRPAASVPSLGASQSGASSFVQPPPHVNISKSGPRPSASTTQATMENSPFRTLPLSNWHCKLCHKGFSGYKELHQHLQDVVPCRAEYLANFLYICFCCKKAFPTLKDRQMYFKSEPSHQVKHQDISRAKASEVLQPGQVVRYCKQCCTAFVAPGDFHCAACTAAFQSAHALRKHWSTSVACRRDLSRSKPDPVMLDREQHRQAVAMRIRTGGGLPESVEASQENVGVAHQFVEASQENERMPQRNGKAPQQNAEVQDVMPQAYNTEHPCRTAEPSQQSTEVNYEKRLSDENAGLPRQKVVASLQTSAKTSQNKEVSKESTKLPRSAEVSLQSRELSRPKVIAFQQSSDKTCHNEVSKENTEVSCSTVVSQQKTGALSQKRRISQTNQELPTENVVVSQLSSEDPCHNGKMMRKNVLTPPNIAKVPCHNADVSQQSVKYPRQHLKVPPQPARTPQNALIPYKKAKMSDQSMNSPQQNSGVGSNRKGVPHESAKPIPSDALATVETFTCLACKVRFVEQKGLFSHWKTNESCRKVQEGASVTNAETPSVHGRKVLEGTSSLINAEIPSVSDKEVRKEMLSRIDLETTSERDGSLEGLKCMNAESLVGKFSCDVCKLTFDSREPLYKHLKGSSSCQRLLTLTASGRKTLETVLHKKSDVNSKKPKGTFSCLTCKSVFNERQELNAHWEASSSCRRLLPSLDDIGNNSRQSLISGCERQDRKASSSTSVHLKSVCQDKIKASTHNMASKNGPRDNKTTSHVSFKSSSRDQKLPCLKKKNSESAQLSQETPLIQKKIENKQHSKETSHTQNKPDNSQVGMEAPRIQKKAEGTPRSKELTDIKKKAGSAARSKETPRIQNKSENAQQRMDTPRIQKNTEIAQRGKETPHMQKKSENSHLRMETPHSHKKAECTLRSDETPSIQKKVKNMQRGKETSCLQKNSKSSQRSKETSHIQKKSDTVQVGMVTPCIQKDAENSKQNRGTTHIQKDNSECGQQVTLALRVLKTPEIAQQGTETHRIQENSEITRQSNQKNSKSLQRSKETPRVKKKLEREQQGMDTPSAKNGNARNASPDRNSKNVKVFPFSCKACKALFDCIGALQKHWKTNATCENVLRQMSGENVPEPSSSSNPLQTQQNLVLCNSVGRQGPNSTVDSDVNTAACGTSARKSEANTKPVSRKRNAVEDNSSATSRKKRVCSEKETGKDEETAMSECRLCRKVIAASELQNHMSLVHKSDASDDEDKEKITECLACGMKMQKAKLKDHFAKLHLLEPRNKKNKV